MSFVAPTASTAIPAGAIPQRLMQTGGTGGTATYSFFNGTTSGTLVFATTLEATCTGSEPTQWFCEASIRSIGRPFFHDSQSTGEGEGITFAWRGLMYVPPEDHLDVLLTEISGVDLFQGVYLHGFYLPGEQIF